MYFHTRKMCFPISWWHTSSIGSKKGYANKKVRLSVTPHTALITVFVGKNMLPDLDFILKEITKIKTVITEIGVGEEGDIEPHATQAAGTRGKHQCSQLLRVYHQTENLTLVSCCWSKLDFVSFLELQLNSICFAMGPLDFPGGSVAKNPPDNAGGMGSIPGSGRSPGEGNGNPFQYSHLENSVGRGAWRAAKSRVAKSQTWHNDWVCAVGVTCLPNYIHGQRTLTSWTSLGWVAQGSDVLAWVRHIVK